MIPPEVLDYGISKKAAEATSSVCRFGQGWKQWNGVLAKIIKILFKVGDICFQLWRISRIRASSMFKAYIFQLQDAAVLA